MKTPNYDNEGSKGRAGSQSDSTNGRGRPRYVYPKLKKVSLWVTNEQDDFLNQLKNETGLDKSEHHRRAIDLYRSHLQK